ncbi:MAG: lipoyl(octanoyl) transferase LipB [Solirubrobacterales bacterium]|nr:lipoyl(octanoyl) transferase LipB [Solirubrobacterales bacterium]
MSAHRPSRDELWVCQLGTVPYRRALATQLELCRRRQAHELPDLLLLLEHPPVYTRGRRSHPHELSLGEPFYRARGIEIVDTDRGGRITYHGPGQLVGYPIMAVPDVLAHLRSIEAALIHALARLHLDAHSRAEEGPDYTGVWVGPRKIASIGVHVQRHISTHGFALNVDMDLEPFSWVVPCGLPDVHMTSIAAELPPAPDAGMRCLRRLAAHSFCEVHARRQRLVSPRRLGIDAPVASPPPAGAPAASTRARPTEPPRSVAPRAPVRTPVARRPEAVASG